MKDNFTDLVRDSVIKTWLKLDIESPKNYLINFDLDNIIYQLYSDIERTMLEVYYEYFNEYRQKEHLAEASNKLGLFKEYISTADFQKDLVNSFPELISYIKLREEFFNRYINKLLKDLDTWWEDYNFKSLDRINCFSGDSHNQGQHVCQIIVDTDKSFYYKPRSSQVEKGFNELLADFMDIENFVVYSKEAFSIHKEISYIYPKSDDEIKRYYYKLGVSAAIFYLFNTVYMHYENMIIHKDIPYFIDLETITALNHNYLQREINAFRNFLNNSVLGSNVFPTPLLANKIDVSVVTGVYWEENDDLSYSIDFENDSEGELRLVKTINLLEGGKNEIIIDGKKVNPMAYLKDLRDGFTYAGNKIIQNKEEFQKKMLNLLKGQKKRQILRPTNTYAKFLNISLEAYYMQSQKSRDSVFDILKKGIYNSCENLIKSEVQSLKAGDIPMFFADLTSLDVYDAGGNIIERDFFAISSEETIKNKLEKFTEDDMDRQVSLMERSIYVASFNKYEREDFPDLSVKKEGHIEDICYQDCLSYYKSFFEEDDYLFNINVVENGDKLALWPTDFSLYDSGGILLLSFLRKELDIPDEFFYKFTYTVNELKTQGDMGLNAYTGLGSILYFLYTFYKKDKSPLYRKNIRRTLERIEEKSLEKIENFDYFTGIGGLLAVLSTTYKDMLNNKKNEDQEIISKTLDLIKSFQNIFLHKWQVIRKKYKAGLGHGLAGIYYSLGLSYKCNENQEILDMVYDLISLEDGYYLETYNDYEDPRNQVLGNFYLCYGIVGILLVRLELYRLGLVEKSTLVEKIDKLIDQVKAGFDFSSMTYSLCHGIASLIELFVEIEAINYRKEEIRQILDKLIVEELKNSRNGYGDKIDIDSFMVGKLGKSYAIIRTFKPELPSFTLLKFDAK